MVRIWQQTVTGTNTRHRQPAAQNSTGLETVAEDQIGTSAGQTDTVTAWRRRRPAAQARLPRGCGAART
ncbi:MAG: hypothetical protein ACLUTY_06940 [Waltera sp.]